MGNYIQGMTPEQGSGVGDLETESTYTDNPTMERRLVTQNCGEKSKTRAIKKQYDKLLCTYVLKCHGEYLNSLKVNYKVFFRWEQKTKDRVCILVNGENDSDIDGAVREITKILEDLSTDTDKTTMTLRQYSDQKVKKRFSDLEGRFPDALLRVSWESGQLIIFTETCKIAQTVNGVQAFLNSACGT